MSLKGLGGGDVDPADLAVMPLQGLHPPHVLLAAHVRHHDVPRPDIDVAHVAVEVALVVPVLAEVGGVAAVPEPAPAAALAPAPAVTLLAGPGAGPALVLQRSYLLDVVLGAFGTLSMTKTMIDKRQP